MGFCRSSLRVPAVLLQTPHLASAQDLDSRLSGTEAPPLIPGPSLLKTWMSGSQRMRVVLILPPRLPWTDNRDGLL